MVHQTEIPLASIPGLGLAKHRFFCNSEHDKVSNPLQQRGKRPLVLRGRSPPRLDGSLSLHVSPDPITVSSATQTEGPMFLHSTYNSMVAKTSVVHDVATGVKTHIQTPAVLSRSTIPWAARCPPSRLTQSGSNSMVDSSMNFSDRVSNVILNSIKQSTRHSYAAKWSRFCSWLGPGQLSPTEVGFSRVFDFYFF